MNQAQDTLSKRRQWLAASALIPVIGALSRPAALQALIFSIFVCIYLTPFVIKATKEKFGPLPGVTIDPANQKIDGASLAQSAAAQIKMRQHFERWSNANFVLIVVAAGMISECLAWVSELFSPNIYPTLLHPQLYADLFLAFFFYAGLALAWLLLSRRYQYNLPEIFFVSFLAALLKQAKLGLLPGLCEKLVYDPLAALLTLSSLLVVGGSIGSLGFVACHKLGAGEKKNAMPKLLTKYLISLIVVALVPELTYFGGTIIAKPLGLCPAKKPVWDAPLI